MAPQWFARWSWSPQVRGSPVLSFDTETFLIAPGRLAPPLVCLSWSDGHTKAVVSPDEGAAWFRAQLEAGETLVGHNVAYDVAVLLAHDPSLRDLIWAHYDRGLFVDTAIADRLHFIERGWYRKDPSGKRPRFTLSALSARYLGEALEGKSDADAWRYRYRELHGVPIRAWPDEAVQYAADDALATARVWQKIGERERPDLVRQVQSAWSLHLVSAWGMRTDPDAVNQLREKLERSIGDLKRQLVGAGLLRPSGSRDMAAVQSRVLHAYTSENAPRTSSGRVSTSREVLQGSSDMVLHRLAEYGALEKLLSTYIPVLESGTVRPVNPSYWLAESGRTTCKNPNVQNQPRYGGVRECWVPRAGYVYVACDYHIAELCALAQICFQWFGFSKMRDAINAGRGLHLVTAAAILGIPYEEATERYKAGDKEVKGARQLAKAANFGFGGGLGSGSFADFAKASYGLEISESDAKELKKQWLASYPEMRKYFERIADQCGPVGEFTAVQVRSGRKRGGCGFTDGANGYFQGLVADGGRAAVYRTVRATHTPGDVLYGCHVVAFIHDEILLEAPSDKGHEAAMRLSEIMVEAMSEWCPDVTISADAHLMERWYKEAEPVYERGRLVPWRHSHD